MPSNRTMLEEFQIAREGMLNQGVKSLSADGSHCRYRGEDDCSCAIGFLIEDDVATNLDDHLKTPAIDTFFDVATNLSRDRAKFYSCLQFIHDECKTEKWYSTLNTFFAMYEKEITEGTFNRDWDDVFKITRGDVIFLPLV